MTDRISAYTVFLTEDVRVDEDLEIVTALRMVKGVMRVTPHVADPAADVTEMRVRREIETKVMEVLRASR